jgi:hypothetical protein
MCVHIRNILRAQGRYRNVKVPSSPYKRGREGTCKRIQTFLGLVLFAESISDSLRPNCVLERVKNSSRVRVIIRIFRVFPQQTVEYRCPPPRSTMACPNTTGKYSFVLVHNPYFYRLLNQYRFSGTNDGGTFVPDEKSPAPVQMCGFHGFFKADRPKPLVSQVGRFGTTGCTGFIGFV